MSWLSKLLNVFRQDRLADDIEREMGFHLAQRTHDLVALGMTPEAARTEARRRFGNPGVHMEKTRDRDLVGWLDTLIADVRYALRGLRAAPGFALAAILSLALGIGANTAIFTVMNAVMLRPLPVPHADQLAYLTSGREETFSYPFYEQFRDHLTSFAGFAAIERGTARHEFAVGEDDTEVVRAPAVTGNYFSVLGVAALLGRTLDSGDDRADASPALVISYGFWQRRFAGDSGVLGLVVGLDGMRATIVGVMPKGFRGFDASADADLWWPIQQAHLLDPSSRGWSDRLTSTGVTWLVLFGRLRQNVSREQTETQAATVFRNALEDVAAGSTWTASERERMLRQTLELHPGSAGYNRLRGMLRMPLFALAAVVAMLLVVVCANVASLMLARATARQREFAVRAALGGGRGRIMRQLLTEGLVLSLCGGAMGFVAAWWTTALLAAYLPRDEISLTLTPDGRVLLFTAVVTLVTTVAFGLAPARRLGRLDVAAAMKRQENPATGRARGRLQPILVATQLAVSVLLLALFGLFGRTLKNLQAIDVGFDPTNVIAFSLDFGRQPPAAQETSDIERRTIAGLAALPGVRSASISGAGMLSGNGYSFEFSVDDRHPSAGEELRVYAVLAGPHFFQTLGVPLLRGREFDSRDEGVAATDSARGAASVVVLGDRMARTFFGDTDPIGRHITRRPDGTRLTIIGVAGDTKYRADPRDETPMEVYLPYFGAAVRMPSTIYLRMEPGTPSLVADVRRVVAELGYRATVRDVITMDERLDQVLVRERLVAQLAGFFSIFALLLASIGLYGVVSYGVARRTRELGVRVALGATSGDVLHLVLRQGFFLALTGCALGLTGAMLVGRLMASLFYGVGASDPLTHALVSLVLLFVALLACWIPARRATRVDPVTALRAE